MWRTSVTDKSKKRTRALAKKAGMSYQAAHNQLRQPSLRRRGPTVPPTILGPAILLDGEGHVVGHEAVFVPHVEVMSVEGFDPTDLSKSHVRFAPNPAGKRPPRPRTLDEHIAMRERETGWKLLEIRPAPDVDRLAAAVLAPPPEPLPSVSSVRLIWDPRAGEKGGER